jgi:hypothetical protein
MFTGVANNAYRLHTCGIPDHVAQTFTAGISGSLSKIALTLSTENAGPPSGSPHPYPLDISIQTVDAMGAPSGTEIGAGTTPGPSGVVAWPGVNWEIPLSSPAQVVAGTQYAIVMAESTCPAAENGWFIVGNASAADAYPGGALWFQNSVGGPTFTPWAQVAPPPTLIYDNFFTTWVTH